MKTSTGLTSPQPYIEVLGKCYKPSAIINSSSLTAPGLSVLFPIIAKGTVYIYSLYSNFHKSSFASWNREGSEASTIYMIASIYYNSIYWLIL